MIPRATALDPRPFAALRHGGGRVADWCRARALGVFVVVHCVLAGALQLGALVIDLARAGRPVPSGATLAWAWLGLALISTVPALVTTLGTLARGRPPRFLAALVTGLLFYCLPVLLLVGSI